MTALREYHQEATHDDTLTQEIAAAYYDDGSLTLSQLASQATNVFETDGREYDIGSRGATLEDIEATRAVLDQPEGWSEEVN